MGNWKNILVRPDTSVLETIKTINLEGLRAALVVDENNELLGMVTDGDIRRSILNAVDMSSPVSTIMNRAPTVAFDTDDRECVLAKLKSLKIYHLPIINSKRIVVGFETLESFLSTHHQSNMVVVMAGGLGKRLYPLTLDRPKPLLKIGDKPVLEILLENFIKKGFHHFYFAVNYKAEMIKDYFKNGQYWGVNIQYIEETKQLGTAGALSLLTMEPDKPFFVVNADVITNVDFLSLLAYHNESKAIATMCIREHEQVVPYGVVERDASNLHLLSIVEKPKREFYVNAGIYVLEPTILRLLKADEYCDMTDLLSLCVATNHRVSTFPIREYWLDIGRLNDLQQAHLDYEKVF